MLRHPLYDRGNIYLSGGMQFAKNKGASWRVECSKKLRDMKYFPLDICEMDRAYAKAHGELYDMIDVKKHLQYKSNFRRHFIYTDIQLVKNDSDALIIMYDESVRRGAGTVSECQEAYDHDIPILLVSGYENWATEVPGWLQGLTTKIFVNFEELYQYLDQLPHGILKRDIYGNHATHQQYLCSLCGNVFEKTKHHFVSHVSPLYCKSCVKLVVKTYEGLADRYQFFIDYLLKEQNKEIKGTTDEQNS